jgi:hypothetical protein
MSYKSNRGEKRKLSSTDDLDFFYIYDTKRYRLWPKLHQSKNTPESTEFKNFSCTGKTKKLFDICLRFIANHVEWVESFEKFPSLIAHQIFSECISIGRFDLKNIKNQSAINCILRLFAQTYPDELASSLNLANNYRLFKMISESINFFSLKTVDLSNCDLNASENGIRFIDLFERSLNSLEVLNLSDNSLDDEFVAKFTLPQRLNLKTFSKLTLIDLSQNRKLTSTCLNYFYKYPKLNEVVLSFEKAASICKNGAKFQLCKCASNDLYEIKNIGWIKPIIEANKSKENGVYGL